MPKLISSKKGAISMPTINSNFIPNFSDWNTQKSRVRMRLLNAKHIPSDMPRVGFLSDLDLAVAFHLELPEGLVPIKENFLPIWEIGPAQLLEAARENDQSDCPYVIEHMRDVLGCDDLDTPFYILTNRNRFYGAAALSCKPLIRQFAEKFPQFYILPSSVHECLLLPDSGDLHPACLKQMVHDVNETEVRPEERLSYQIYYYADGTITML